MTTTIRLSEPIRNQLRKYKHEHGMTYDGAIDHLLEATPSLPHSPRSSGTDLGAGVLHFTDSDSETNSKIELDTQRDSGIECVDVTILPSGWVKATPQESSDSDGDSRPTFTVPPHRVKNIDHGEE